MVCAVVGLLFAFFLIKAVIRLSPGNERMRQIAGAIEEGAKAYLKRQVITISVIAIVIFILLFFFRDKASAIGFLIGAFCSLARRIHRDADRGPGQHPNHPGGHAIPVRRHARCVQRGRRHRPPGHRPGPAFGRHLLHPGQELDGTRARGEKPRGAGVGLQLDQRLRPARRRHLHQGGRRGRRSGGQNREQPRGGRSEESGHDRGQRGR